MGSTPKKSQEEQEEGTMNNMHKAEAVTEAETADNTCGEAEAVAKTQAADGEETADKQDGGRK
jgi:hypothetical protein